MVDAAEIEALWQPAARAIVGEERKMGKNQNDRKGNHTAGKISPNGIPTIKKATW